MAAVQPSFVLLNDDELAELVDAADSTNTKKQIQFAVHRLEAFAECAGTSLATVQGYGNAELDKFLSRFYGGLRRNNGDLYTKKSMHAIRYGLHRHFQATKDIDICNSDMFKESDKTYKAMMVKLKQSGKGAVKHKKAVSAEDMTKIIDSLDTTTPIGLQNKVFIDVMTYFANRGRENLRSTSISDFDLEVDEQNLRYITRRDTMTKSRRECEDEACSGHMYEIPGSSRCPVRSFLALKEVLNPAEKCMWQRPKAKAPTDGSPWYMNAPLGINTIGNKMREISEKAGCSQVYTNHSLRATTCTVLDEAGFPNRHIMSVTGHRSESSLKHYSRTSDKKKKLMSEALANEMSENAPKPAEPEVQSNENVLEGLDSLLTDSQEQLILSESNFNIQSATSTSSVQHFHFHGPVTFYNK
ncbi:uncharacterized protein KIAA1958-like [Diadema antillarum]|uniref:uncharacterized protein KIAA1958-like n=1 Tax=Diadema antillarum TaxID=105358 RepID=UPI003A84F45A